jgi:phage terminase small subunit
MTNRKQPGAQNDYLAGVHHRLAAQLNSLATLPVWLTDWRALRAIVQEYAAMGYYCELEAALERRQPVVAYKACARMVIAARRSRLGLTLFTAKMIVKTLLMRPSFPKVGHP